MSAAELASTPPIDYLRPIIADGDTGHGGLTAVMKVSTVFLPGTKFELLTIPN
jgi:isocitrate lyase